MSPRKFGLVAALMAAALVPAAAMSQAKISDADLKAGMAEAPAVVQAAGLGCQVTEARKIGATKADKKTGAGATTYYEVACQNSLGFVLQSPEGGTPTTFNCLEANNPPAGQKESSIACKLPGNSDPKAGLAPYLAKAGVQCTPANARGIGSSKESSFLEVACSEGSGYIIVAPAPMGADKEVQAQNCLAFDDTDGNVKCTLSDKAARLAVVDNYVKAANNNCAIKERRFVGNSTDGSSFFETSCEDGKGYIYKVAGGQLAQTWGCATAENVLGGCTLTDARQAASEQAALYTKLAKAAGSSCDVEKYAIFPAQGSTEAVELVCKGGAAGGVGLFPASGAGKVLDCGRAMVAGYKCGLNPAGSGNDQLTADLKKFGQNSCTVSASRLMGKTAEGTTLLEVACSDGLAGYVIEYDANISATKSTGCRFAGGCKLPGNT